MSRLSISSGTSQSVPPRANFASGAPAKPEVTPNQAQSGLLSPVDQAFPQVDRRNVAAAFVPDAVDAPVPRAPPLEFKAKVDLLTTACTLRVIISCSLAAIVLIRSTRLPR
jgi:hypothetical protein